MIDGHVTIFYVKYDIKINTLHDLWDILYSFRLMYIYIYRTQLSYHSNHNQGKSNYTDKFGLNFDFNVCFKSHFSAICGEQFSYTSQLNKQYVEIISLAFNLCSFDLVKHIKIMLYFKLYYIIMNDVNAQKCHDRSIGSRI